MAAAAAASAGRLLSAAAKARLSQIPVLPGKPAASGKVLGSSFSSRVLSNQGQHHFPGISKVTEGMKFADQKRFLSFERKPDDANLTEWARPALNRLKECLNGPIDPRYDSVAIIVMGVTSFVRTAITDHNLHNDINPITWGSMFGSGKTAAKDVN
ncbi:hypothetical protein ACP4OV_030383 [Aristida adscensionis]